MTWARHSDSSDSNLKVHNPLNLLLQQEDLKKRQSTAFANFILSEVLDTRVDARKWNLTFLRVS